MDPTALRAQGPLPVTLTSLSQDCFHVIALYLPSTSLSALMKSSRSLHENVKPALYRFLHYSDDRPRNSEDLEPGFYRSMEGQAPFRGSRICNIAFFHRTINSNPALLSHIRGVSFDWDNYYGESYRDFHGPRCGPMFSILLVAFLDKTLRFLVESSSPTFTPLLHLSPLSYDFDLCMSAKLTSLDLQYMPCYKELKLEPTIEELYSIFGIPTLRQISLIGRSPWKLSRVHPGTCTPHVSNVTSLSIVNSIPAAAGALIDVLTWPKALKEFKVQWSRISMDRAGQLLSGLNNVCLSGALQSQRDTIEHINLTSDVLAKEWDVYDKPDAVMDCRKFVRLKRVSLPRSLLAKTSQEICRGGFAGLPKLYELLPSTLEALYIELEEGFFWNGVYNRETEAKSYPPQLYPRQTGGLDHGSELKAWLLDMVRHKSKCYPHLRKVVLWQRKHWGAWLRECCLRPLSYLEQGGIKSSLMQTGVELSFIHQKCCEEAKDGSI